MKEYKVLTQADKFFGGKFNAEKLEQLLNEYGKLGWRVIAITSQETPHGFKSNGRQEIVVVLEYDSSKSK